MMISMLQDVVTSGTGASLNQDFHYRQPERREQHKTLLMPGLPVSHLDLSLLFG